MSPTLPTSLLVETDDIILIGFDENFKDYFKDLFGYESGFKFRSFERSFVAFRWLNRRINQEHINKLPKVIICNLSYLEEENFLFARNLQSHETLNTIPVLVVATTPTKSLPKMMKYGIDDFYQSPILFDDLKNKIEFLSKYKPLIIKEKGTAKEEVIPHYHIPFLKRVFDIGIALIAIVLLSPVWLLIALAIRLESKGSIIYCSKRVGTGYTVFDFLKFRSMYQDADKRLKDLEHLNQYSDGEDNVFKKINNDPRVTKIGRLIRKTSLDEMPQLINVLKGEMSIVGNRPLPLYEAELLTKDDWAGRFLAPAGCTGLWQISKRGKADMSSEERISLDVTYAQNYSFWYDLKIMLKTIPALIQEENV